MIEQAERLRRQRHTGKQIEAEVGISPATVSRILRRLGLNKISALVRRMHTQVLRGLHVRHAAILDQSNSLKA